jgi:hypothetical protein
VILCTRGGRLEERRKPGERRESKTFSNTIFYSKNRTFFKYFFSVLIRGKFLVILYQCAPSVWNFCSVLCFLDVHAGWNPADLGQLVACRWLFIVCLASCLPDILCMKPFVHYFGKSHLRKKKVYNHCIWQKLEKLWEPIVFGTLKIWEARSLFLFKTIILDIGSSEKKFWTNFPLNIKLGSANFLKNKHALTLFLKLALLVFLFALFVWSRKWEFCILCCN